GEIRTVLKSSGSPVSRGLLLAAGRTETAEGDVKMIHSKASLGRELLEDRFGEIDVEDRAADVAMKMSVFAHVAAEAGGLAVAVDLTDQAALDQLFQAVVDRRQRDRWHLAPHAAVDLVGRRMVAFVHENVVHQSALPRHPQAFACQRGIQSVFVL